MGEIQPRLYFRKGFIGETISIRNTPFRSRILKAYFGFANAHTEYHIQGNIYLPVTNTPSLHLDLEHRVEDEDPHINIIKFKMDNLRDIGDLLKESRSYDVKELENKKVFFYTNGSSIDAISIKKINLRKLHKSNLNQPN